MNQKLRMFAIRQTATSLQRTYNLNPRTIWYPTVDESKRMKSACYTIHLSKNPPPKNACWLKSFFFKSTGFTSSTSPIQPGFSQNQPAAITLNTDFPGHGSLCHSNHPTPYIQTFFNHRNQLPTCCSKLKTLAITMSIYLYGTLREQLKTSYKIRKFTNEMKNLSFNPGSQKAYGTKSTSRWCPSC
jgi:hypothetical protein